MLDQVDGERIRYAGNGMGSGKSARGVRDWLIEVRHIDVSACSIVVIEYNVA